MPRFLLLIKELGKAPRVVPLTSPLLVGRSRRADLVVDDDEVGREQFRLTLLGSGVEIEGIGQTNRTLVDGTQVGPGQRLTLVVGATVKVGKTTFVVQAGDTTEAPPAQPGNVDATLVAPRPKPEDGNRQEQEQTGGASSPMGTMQMPRPVAPGGSQAPGKGQGDAAFDATMPPKAYRPGGAPPPAATPPAKPPAPNPAPGPAAAGDDLNNLTMPPKAYRPGAASPKPQEPPAPPARPAAPVPPTPKPNPAQAAADDAMANLTMPPQAYRPGKPQPPTESSPNVTMPVSRPGGQAASPPRPAVPPAAAPPPAVPPAQAKPQAAPAAAASPAAPAAPPPRPVGAKPTTVLVRPAELPPAAIASGLSPADLEGRLHASVPRLLVKGEGMKRRIRLMKQRSRIGRAETADVLLPHETVSEQHAELQFDGARWSLLDSGSANGTLVDGSLVRAAEQPIERNTLLGFGNLRAIFLCNSSDSRIAKEQRAHEQRAVQFLVAQGRLGRELARQVQQLVRQDQSQSLGEVLLMETPLEPADWQSAIAATRDQLGLFARIRRYFARLRGGAPQR